MGFLTSAESVVAAALAAALEPPLPPDITRWCEENVVFDERSPMPGPFSIRRFPFLREIHEVLSPEHPCREVTVRGSAQWGKTVSVINPTVAAWHEYTPLDSLVVHPTTSSATEWVDNKWLPMRRQAPSLRQIFGDGRTAGDHKDAKFNQETLARNGSLKIASAGSPDDLAGTTRRLVILDDLSKFIMTPKGDPEELAVSRASGFEDAKILRVSTPQIKGTCRITASFARSDQRYYDVPCPHCGNMAPLTWENFLQSLNPERLHAAHFTCESCGCAIEHFDKERIVGQGRWAPRNPKGDHPGFFLWRAYTPQRDWASIAVEYARVMGWTRLVLTAEAEEAVNRKVDDKTEQTFWNDTLGLPYEQASEAPDWEALRDRVEKAEPDAGFIGKGFLPATGFILGAGVDCQDDRIEVQIVAFGRNRRRWVIDYRIIPHFIGDQAGSDALDALLKTTWRTTLGLPVGIDMLAIDSGTYTDDVWTWGKRHPWSRVILVKGASGQNGPVLEPQKFERRRDGKAKRQQKRAFMLNVSQLKGDFYTQLRKDDPQERGYVAFALGLDDEYYRQLTAEVRVLTRLRSGTVVASWKLAEAGRRNEALDTMNYAEAAARRKGWLSLTDEEWDQLEAERSAPPVDRQGDLFDATLPIVPAAPVPVAATDAARQQQPAQESEPGKQDGDWLGVDPDTYW